MQFLRSPQAYCQRLFTVITVALALLLGAEIAAAHQLDHDLDSDHQAHQCQLCCYGSQSMVLLADLILHHPPGLAIEAPQTRFWISLHSSNAQIHFPRAPPVSV